MSEKIKDIPPQESLENYYQKIAQQLFDKGYRLKALPDDKEYYVLTKDGEELGSGLLRGQQNMAELFELLEMPLNFDDEERDKQNKQPILDALIDLSLQEQEKK